MNYLNDAHLQNSSAISGQGLTITQSEAKTLTLPSRTEVRTLIFFAAWCWFSDATNSA